MSTFSPWPYVQSPALTGDIPAKRRGKVLLAMLFPLLLSMLFTGCGRNPNTPPIPAPDFITYYAAGVEYALPADSAAFDIAYQYAIKRFPEWDTLGKLKLDYGQDLLESFKDELCLVFQYDKPITIRVNDISRGTKILYFPLSGEYEKSFFGAGALGWLKSAQSLREYLAGECGE